MREPLANINKMKKMKTVKIGSQEWCLENFSETTFQNGDLIPQAQSYIEWRDAFTNKSPAWCYYDFYNDDLDKKNILYNWWAANDKRIIAPDGFKIPTLEDWNILKKYLGDDAGTKLKSKTGWLNVGNGTNSSGFTAYPFGERYWETFRFRYYITGFWSSTIFTDRPDHNDRFAYASELRSEYDTFGINSQHKRNGLSIRLLSL